MRLRVSRGGFAQGAVGIDRSGDDVDGDIVVIQTQYRGLVGTDHPADRAECAQGVQPGRIGVLIGRRGQTVDADPDGVDA
jgi:hypothetical protein